MYLRSILRLCYVVCIFLHISCKSNDKKSSPISSQNEDVIHSTPVERHGFLQVSGNKIFDEHGEVIQLKGMSLFWSQWKGQYYTKEVVDWLVEDWKCAVVRAALGVEMGGYLQNPEREFEKVITVVDAAIAKGIYVIVDWHDHHGEQHLPESKAFFAQIAQRYGKHPNIIYELYNEPLNVSWSVVLKPYHQAIIDTIRYYDQRNLIVCGTPNWSQDVDQVIQDPINDKNVSYALHFYATTHREGLRKKAKAALDKGLSIFVTEFGTTESTGNGLVDTNETALWMQFMDDYKLSWCNWSIADKNETSAALVGGASTTGGWTSDVITPSGKLVREYIRQSNP